MNPSHIRAPGAPLVSRPRAAARQQGFTLIELMITAAIIAILAAIAIPSYQDSVWKGKRAEGKAAIFKALQAEERNYTQSNTYVAYASGTPPSGSFPGFSADSLATSRYSLSASAGPVTAVDVNGTNTTLCPTSASTGISQCVVVVATVNGAADPNCGNFLAMDSIGNKGSATRVKPVCWN